MLNNSVWIRRQSIKPSQYRRCFFYTSLFLITLMIAEPFWFFSLLKIHLASQLVRLSLNLCRGRCVDEGTGHGMLVTSPAERSPPLQTLQKPKLTSCSWSNDSTLLRLSPTPNTHFTLQTGAKKYSISTEQPLLCSACFTRGICVLWLPSHCQRLIGNLIGRLWRWCLSLSLAHIHQPESIKGMGLSSY